jgi:phosphoribosyl-ATP pyrophosphohydrolase
MLSDISKENDGTMENKELYTQAIEHYGEEKQLVKAMEEAAEFIQATAKYIAKPSDKNRDRMIEEMADLYIMLEQSKMILKTDINTGYSADYEISIVKESKLERLKRRINNTAE